MREVVPLARPPRPQVAQAARVLAPGGGERSRCADWRGGGLGFDSQMEWNV